VTVLILCLSMVVSITAHAAPPRDDFRWRGWGEAAFAEAAKNGKFVLLSLQAWWCEPCHRMNSVTYADPAVRKLIDEKFVPIYVDQDSRTDISQCFERWGWPATVLFAPDGTEIVKLRGFYSPQFFTPHFKRNYRGSQPG
jgi:uncharacterized protein